MPCDTLRDCVELIRSCSSETRAREIHDWIFSRNSLMLNSRLYLSNLLVDMYGRCGSVKSAAKIFASLPHLDYHSWVLMISAYGRNGWLYGAKATFDVMPYRGLVAWNCLLGAYARAGHMEDSKRIFDAMPAWDILSWTEMLLVSGWGPSAKVLFESMPEWDVVCCNVVLAANAKEGKMLQVKAVFDSMREWSMVSYNTLLDTVAKTCDVDRVRECFDAFPAADMVTWNILLCAYTRDRDVNTAKSLFNKMINHDTLACNTMLYAYGRKGLVEDAAVLFSMMSYRDMVSCNSMLLAYALNGYLEEARELYEKLPPDVVASTIMISAYGQDGNLCKAVCLFHDVGFRDDQALWNAVLSAYVHSGSLLNATLLFKRLPWANTISWNTIAAANAKAGRTKEVLSLLPSMAMDGLKPDTATLHVVLVGCNHGGDFRGAWSSFVSMVRDFGIQPSREAYCCVLDLLVRAGYVGAAKDLYENMPYEPEAVDWECSMRILQGIRVVD